MQEYFEDMTESGCMLQLLIEGTACKILLPCWLLHSALFCFFAFPWQRCLRGWATTCIAHLLLFSQCSGRVSILAVTRTYIFFLVWTLLRITLASYRSSKNLWGLFFLGRKNMQSGRNVLTLLSCCYNPIAHTENYGLKSRKSNIFYIWISHIRQAI